MDSSDIVSVVALIVSIIALFGTVLQVLQQYYASAVGYSNCGEKVMGEWSQTKSRVFRAGELRFEVQFDAPVIFMCEPDNKKGPVPNQPLRFIKGTRESEEYTMTPSVEREKEKKDRLSHSARLSTAVHTADNERASWVILLQALHAMERYSQQWQEEELVTEQKEVGPKAGLLNLPSSVAKWESHSVVAALQPKRRSWDTMPSEVGKPYATTTFCHIVEMAAILGLHWKQFNRSNHNYLAEGNGYLLTGREVDDLGTMFTFQIYGKNKFQQNRIIPTDEIKLLAFGNVSTIFKFEPDTNSRVPDPYDMDDPKRVLQLGSTAELVESLTHFGCNSKTTSYFRDAQKKQAHIFPVVFEIVGMLAKPMYIPDTYYRYLPNPTTYSWNKKNFSLRKLLLEFHNAVNDTEISPLSDHVLQIQNWALDLRKHLKKDKWSDEKFPIALLNALHKAIKQCDDYLEKEGSRMVTIVIREHIQEVMRLLNETPSGSGSGSGGSGGEDSKLSKSSSKDSQTSRTFDELNSAGPEEKQKKFMDIYFTTVVHAVTKNCHEVLRKQKSTQYEHSPRSSTVHLSQMGSPAGGRQDGATGRPVTSGTNLSSPMQEKERPGTPQLLLSTPSTEEFSTKLRRMPTSLHEELTTNIWCTLVFRMLCWLMLHDFHKKDVQISKSELLGSRLPVYIA